MTPELCEFEIDVLRLCAGERVEGLIPGAAMWQAVECLRGSGYLTRLPDGTHIASARGVEYLASRRS